MSSRILSQLLRSSRPLLRQKFSYFAYSYPTPALVLANASARRPFSANFPQRQEAPTRPRPPPERDPSHPSLYYHSVSAEAPIYALSFLAEPLNDAVPNSRTILGWVGEGVDSQVGFQENPGFREILHESIAKALREPGCDEALEAEALQRGEGWLNINDTRNVPSLNRVGDPDDIIGTVMVQEGKLLGSTYQPMPTYRICTADGPTRLTEGLMEKFKEALRREYEAEKSHKST